jgi:hypothetical protein
MMMTVGDLTQALHRNGAARKGEFRPRGRES